MGDRKDSEANQEIDELVMDRAARIVQVTRRRTVLKGIVTKRINKIMELINASESRTKVRYYKTALLEAHEEQKKVGTEMERLAPSEDIGWVDEEIERTREVLSDVEVYLESRKGEPSSRDSQISPWLIKNNPGAIPPNDENNDYQTIQGYDDVASGEMRKTSRLDEMSYVNMFSYNKSNATQQHNGEIYVNMNQDDISNSEKFEMLNSDVMFDKNQVTLENLHDLNVKELDKAKQKGLNFNPTLVERRDERFYANKLKALNDGVKNDTFIPPTKQRVRSHETKSTNERLFAEDNRRREGNSIFDQDMDIHPNEVGGNNLLQHTFSRSRRRTLPKLPGFKVYRAVDAWIDELNEAHDKCIGEVEQANSERAMMAILNQQNLPRLSIPKFNGKPENWLEFVRKFHDLIHKDAYMSGIRKCALLYQHLEGDAHRAVAGLPCDWMGYVSALKRIKFLFGNTAKVVTSLIRRITTGQTIKHDNLGQMSQFLYNVSDCIIALKQLASTADLRSNEVMNAVGRRLPRSLQNRWAKRVSKMNNAGEFPDLEKFEEWLREEVITLREVENYRTADDSYDKSQRSRSDFNGFFSHDEKTCKTCSKGVHPLFKCEEYKRLRPKERYSCAVNLGICFCCLSNGHKIGEC